MSRLMMVVSVLLGLLLLTHAFGFERNVGDQIWALELSSDAASSGEVAALRAELDVLQHSTDGLQVLVRRDELLYTRALLQQRDIPYRVAVEDVGLHLKEALTADAAGARSRAATVCVAGNCPRPLRDGYMTFEQIEWFLHALAESYSDNVQLRVVGKTREGRSIYLVSVTQAEKAKARSTKAAVRKGVFVDGGMHAREWVSPATVTNILMSQTESCAAMTDCDNDYYFMPMLNPDGYVHSWTTDRYWRKNRSLPPTGSKCYGTDINRNFMPAWGKGGSSSDSCTQVYHGVSAFSEPESRAAKDVLQSLVDDPSVDMRVYIAYHSYGYLILHPLGYSKELADDAVSMREGADVYQRAVAAVHGAKYDVKQASYLYVAAGASDDFAHSLNVMFPFTVELRGKSFVLPVKEIAPAYEENYAGYKALIKFANSQ